MNNNIKNNNHDFFFLHLKRPTIFKRRSRSYKVLNPGLSVLDDILNQYLYRYFRIIFKSNSKKCSLKRISRQKAIHRSNWFVLGIAPNV